MNDVLFGHKRSGCGLIVICTNSRAARFFRSTTPSVSVAGGGGGGAEPAEVLEPVFVVAAVTAASPGICGQCLMRAAFSLVTASKGGESCETRARPFTVSDDTHFVAVFGLVARI